MTLQADSPSASHLQPDSPSAAFGHLWPCWLEIDLDAVRHNVRALQQAGQPRLGVTAVIKAQAYGLGASAIARAALDAGARGAAVARVVEGAQLRAAGISAPILLMGALAPAQADDVVRLTLTPTVTDWGTAQALAAAAHAAGRVLDVQVKVDTGMTRFGAPPDEAKALVRGLRDLASLSLGGFYTHFAAADERDDWFARQQLARFLAVCSQLEREGFDLGSKHAANSAGTLRVADAGLDTVRTGIGLAGCYASEFVPRQPALKPAVSMKARIVRLHSPPIGASIGYGRTYKVQRPLQTALIACGYADGLPRACSNRGWVLIHGERAQLVGTVSMDMAMADITHIPDVRPGDEAVIIGTSADNQITLEALAASAGIVPHELLVRLSSRAPRVYLEGGEAVGAATLSAENAVSLPDRG